MAHSIISLTGLALLCMLGWAPALHAQGEHAPTAITFTVGGVAHTAFQRLDVVLADPAEPNGPIRVTHEVRAATGAAYGLGISHWLWPAVGARVAVSYAPTHYRVDSFHANGGAGVTSPPQETALDLWLAETALMLRLPFSSATFDPYLILGGGAVAYRTDGEPGAEAAEGVVLLDQDRIRHVAGVFGAGALSTLRGQRLALRFELTNHVTGTPVRALAATENGWPVRPSEGEDWDREPSVRFANHIRLVLGASVALGSAWRR